MPNFNSCRGRKQFYKCQTHMDISIYSRRLPQISVSVHTFLRKFVCFSKSGEKPAKKLGKIILILEDASGLTLNTSTNVNAK
jgi:hypothetical protein